MRGKKLRGLALLAAALLETSVSLPVYSQELKNEIAKDVPVKTGQVDNPEAISEDDWEDF